MYHSVTLRSIQIRRYVGDHWCVVKYLNDPLLDLFMNSSIQEPEGTYSEGQIERLTDRWIEKTSDDRKTDRSTDMQTCIYLNHLLLFLFLVLVLVLVS